MPMFDSHEYKKCDICVCITDINDNLLLANCFTRTLIKYGQHTPRESLEIWEICWQMLEIWYSSCYCTTV